MSQPDIIKLELPICHSASERPGTEVIDVERVGPDRYRLVDSPGVVEGLARGDEFELCPTDPKGFIVLKRSGYLCVWFYFEEPGVNRGPDGDAVRAAVERFGGLCDGGGSTHLVFLSRSRSGSRRSRRCSTTSPGGIPARPGCSATSTTPGTTSSLWAGGSRRAMESGAWT